MGKCTDVFDRLLSIQAERNTEITKIFQGYRSEMDRIKGRYSERIAAEKSAELVARSRAEIEAAHARAGERAQVAVRELKEELNKYVLAPPDPALLEQLRAAHSFGLELSRGEIEALADSARGNYTALRCIQKIAAESGFRLDFVGVDALEKDLAAISRAFQPSSWCPEGFGREGQAILPDVVWQGANFGRPDSVRIATAFTAAEGARKNLTEGRERWARIGDPNATKSEYTLERIQAPQNAP